MDRAGMVPSERLKVGDRIRLRPEKSVFAGQRATLPSTGSVLEIREHDIDPEMIRVDFPGLDDRAWYTASLFMLMP